MRIFIVPIGVIDSDMLSEIGSALKKIFRCDVELAREIPVPEDSYNSRRRQYHSSTILKNLQLLKPKSIDMVIGVIDVDLYVPELNFVFGEADIITGVTIISLTRLRQEFYGLRSDKQLFHMRAVKEAIHELGHTYGIGHCPDPKCIMFFSNSLRDTDRKGPGFCSVCKSRLGI